MENYTWHGLIHELLEERRTVTEIETNGTTSLFIKEKGQRKEIKDVFLSEEQYATSIHELISMIAVEEEFSKDPKFLVEGRLKLTTGETARVHIVMPPAADLPQVTIAKKSSSLSTLDAIKETGSFNSKMHDFLKAAVECNLTIVLSGGTGAGKTTMLEAMTKLFRMDDRIGVVEDSQELVLTQPNVTYLHSTLWVPGTDKNSVATLSWCVQQINRQRTDKLIIGETRGGEFSDFIIGANSGMEGSLTTIHANSARSALSKMSQFVIIGLPQPVRTANESIAEAIDLIIQLGTTKDGKKRIFEIAEVSNTLGTTESATIATQPLFTYDPATDDWKDGGFTSDKLRRKLEDNNFDIKTFKKINPMGATNIPKFSTNKWGFNK